MERRHFVRMCGMAAAGAALVGGGGALAQDRTRDRLRDPTQDQLRDPIQDRDRTRLRDPIRDEDIYGTQFMTQQERARYREQRRAARDDDERQRLELYHRNQMQIRARNQGVTLPGDPRGMGGGNGMGGGAGGGAGGGGGRQGG